jgi:hypothetical protein
LGVKQMFLTRSTMFKGHLAKIGMVEFTSPEDYAETFFAQRTRNRLFIPIQLKSCIGIKWHFACAASLMEKEAL